MDYVDFDSLAQKLAPTLQVLENKRKELLRNCLLYTSPSPRDTERSRMPSSA